MASVPASGCAHATFDDDRIARNARAIRAIGMLRRDENAFRWRSPSRRGDRASGARDAVAALRSASADGRAEKSVASLQAAPLLACSDARRSRRRIRRGRCVVAGMACRALSARSSASPRQRRQKIPSQSC
jgi:hypothetical protein